MASKNDITGDVLQSRMNSKAFEENFDRIFRKPSRIDTVGQNGNDGLHYEYELNKSTGDVEKVFKESLEQNNDIYDALKNGIDKPNESQFDGN